MKGRRSPREPKATLPRGPKARGSKRLARRLRRLEARLRAADHWARRVTVLAARVQILEWGIAATSGERLYDPPHWHTT